ncbi:spidroin-2-like, partial [Rissa tridactyla]|uniref:spidroin-2-like n=1 Tax=Rissa tridactyla TaxID=75485 RepID=UPI0023BA92AF
MAAVPVRKIGYSMGSPWSTVPVSRTCSSMGSPRPQFLSVEPAPAWALHGHGSCQENMLQYRLAMGCSFCQENQFQHQLFMGHSSCQDNLLQHGHSMATDPVRKTCPIVGSPQSVVPSGHIHQLQGDSGLSSAANALVSGLKYLLPGGAGGEEPLSTMLAQQGLQHRGTGTFSKFERKTQASPRSFPPEDSSCAWLELPGWWSGEPGSGEQQTKPNGPGRFKCAGESAGRFFRSLRAYPFTLCHQTARHPLGAARRAGVAGRRGREPSRRPRCPTGGGSRGGRVPQGPGIRGPGGRAPFGSTSVGADGAGRNPTLAACGRERGRRCAGGGGAVERLPHPEGTPPPRASGSPPGPAWLGPPVAEAVQAEGCRRPGAGRGRGAALSPSRGSGARRESRRWAPVCLRAG